MQKHPKKSNESTFIDKGVKSAIEKSLEEMSGEEVLGELPPHFDFLKRIPKRTSNVDIKKDTDTNLLSKGDFDYIMTAWYKYVKANKNDFPI